jgi:adenine-specific DNA-methyltransferase
VFIEKGAVTNPRLYTIKSVEDLAGVVRSFSNPAVNHWIDASRLSPEEKWLNLLFSPVSQKTASRLPAKIADYFKCRRGIATGANDYFCLSVDEIKRFGLDERDFDPCITKATHAEGLVFAKTDFDRLSLSGKKCYLLNVKGKKSAELEAYLRQGELEGVPIRHLPAHRPIWYQPEPREVADIWAAVFSRERPKFVLNTARVKNLTCYHGLYSRRNCWKDAVLLTIFLNTSIALEAFAGINRFYGGGLKKVEPKDVESMPCPKLPKISDAEAARLLSAIESINGQSDVDVTKPLDKIGRELFT